MDRSRRSDLERNRKYTRDMKLRLLLACFLLVACGKSSSVEQSPVSDIPSADILSGSVFLTVETRAQQSDEFENPGYLWVEAGEELFFSVEGDEPSCSSCHEESLAGVAATFPKQDHRSGEFFNVELQINACRERYQGREPYAYESEELLSLTAFVAHQSRSIPIDVSIEGDAQDLYETGQSEFYKRRGQLNFSCAQCHNENWGKKLRGDTISQGHGNGFPAYRLEWQTLGSLHRRFQDCNTGIRASPKTLGDPLYIALELYLAKRAQGLPLESPAIRR